MVNGQRFERFPLTTNLKTLKAFNLNSSECNSEKISKAMSKNPEGIERENTV